MKVKLLECTPNIEELCYTAARTCYSADGMGDLYLLENEPEKIEKLLTFCIRRGHHSVVEHGTMTYICKKPGCNREVILPTSIIREK